VKKSSRQQRAWVLEEAQKVVARRGLLLEGDPGSYTDPARIVNGSGKLAEYPDILSLVQALPAKGGGFGPLEQPVVDISNTGRPYTPGEEAVIRAAHQQQRSKVWLCRELRRSVGSMNQKCRKLGLRFDHWEHTNRRNTVNDRFFSKLSARSAYWAGLLAADGCIGKAINIELKVVDEVVLQKFMAELGHPGILSYRSMASVDGRGLYAALRFSSRQITDDLENIYRLTRRKSLTLEPPVLKDDKHILAYICGLFEGDGHVSISERNGLRAEFCSASLQLINWLLRMMQRFGVKTNFSQIDRGLSVLYVLTWCGANAERFAELTGSVGGAMDRKWEVFAAHLKR
jgi:hypothetical protein